MIVETIIKWAVPFVCGGAVTWAVTYIKLRKNVKVRSRKD